MMRAAVLGGELWNPFLIGFICPKCLGRKVDELLVLQMAGGGNDQIAGRKTLPVEIQHRIALELPDRVLGSEDRLAQGVVFPETLGKDFVDQIVGIVLVHFYFFEDHAALAANVGGVEDRV